MAAPAARRRLATLGAIALFAAVLLIALVLAFDVVELGPRQEGDRVTVEGTVVEDEIAGPVLDTGEDRLLLSGIEEVDSTVAPGDEVRVEGKFFEFSIHQLSGVQVERVERLQEGTSSGGGDPRVPRPGARPFP